MCLLLPACSWLFYNVLWGLALIWAMPDLCWTTPCISQHKHMDMVQFGKDAQVPHITAFTPS